jgi:hypothetical protein
MVQLTTEGSVAWANDQWYEIISKPRDNNSQKAWLERYTDSSQEEANRQWESLLQGSHTSCDLQLRRLFVPPVADDIKHHIWVTAQGFPLVENGKVKFILGTLTDVSHLKWAESVQARSALRASDAKREQKEFIDVSELSFPNLRLS